MERRISGLFNIAVGILLVFGPWLLFKTCSTEVKIMKCYWSSKSELAIGILFVILGILILTMKDNDDNRRMSILSIAMSIIAILIPAFIIGGCIKPDMACRAVTFPTIYTISTVNIIAQSIIILSIRKKH
ncbi:MAG: DUF4418 family protein [Candidatus Cloacimonetes bacterium]|jgi:cytochrome bd-type quinol oxidase subunit 2|nr:DUF4418 family protein [Candidatus Cloacimonadota bacterium]